MLEKISGVGFPVSTSIKVPARTFSKVQTSTAHAVEEWTPCCHRLLTEFVNLQVLNTVEVQIISVNIYMLFSLVYFLFLTSNFKGFILRFLHHPPSGRIGASQFQAPFLHPLVDTYTS